MNGLAYVLINPYTIAKSRTGGVIARYVARTELNLVAARMFGPGRELVEEYANLIRSADSEDVQKDALIADYVTNSYSPDPVSGRPRRVMMLLFEGDDAVAKIRQVTGRAFLESGSGGTIRDTYGDYVLDSAGNVRYFEPAVLVAPNQQRAAATLRLWSRYSEQDGGILESGVDVPTGGNVEKTLVLLTPDNFKVPSARAGNIIDILSMANLRIVGVKKFRMTVAQAENFYGPVQEALRRKFLEGIGETRIAASLGREFGFEVPSVATRAVSEELAPLFAKQQFESIVKFMTGYSPSDCQAAEKVWLGREECFALVYEGVDAVRKIRGILGQTDPNKAKPGSVRREFGSNILVNAAHASDSVESAQREMGIVDVGADTIKVLVDKHYGSPVSRVKHAASVFPRAKQKIVEFVKAQWKAVAASMKK